MGGNQGVDDEIGEAAGVMMVGDGDLVEISLRRRLTALAIEKAVTEQRKFVVLGCGTARRHGVGPASHPIGVPQLLESVLHATDTRELLLVKGLAQLEKLRGRQWAMVQSKQDFSVALRKMPTNLGICHHCGSSIP